MDTSVSSDADLWRDLAGADEAAFRELFARHRDAVYNYCFRRTASWSSAEDATQATFTALWRRAAMGRVDPLRIDSARPALLAMARDECSNSRRSRDRQHALIDRIRPATTSSTNEIDSWVDAEATMRAIHQALAVLPSGQRDVVELVAWAELSMTETATALRISVGTVKSRLARARARLAQTPAADLLGGDR